MIFVYLLLCFQEPLSPSAILHGGAYPATVWSADDYEAGPQNWGFVQTDDGLIYVANNAAILQYDAAHWRKLQLPNKMGIQAIGLAHGHVYVGGAGDFGRLEYDDQGQWVFRSFLPLLPPDEQAVASVYSVHSVGDTVYFRTNLRLYVYEQDQVKVIDPKSHLWRSFVINDTLYLQLKNSGMCRFIDGEIQALPPELARVSKPPLYGMLPHPKGILGIRSKTMVLLTDTAVLPFEPDAEVAAFLEKNRVYSTLVLSNGLYALGTIYGGLLLMDNEGSLVRIFDESDGLPNNTVMSLFEDRRGGLWCGTADGMMRLEPQSGKVLYDYRAGLPGQVEAYIYHQGTQYAAGSEGLFRRVPAPGGRLRFEPTPIAGQCWSLHADDTGLMVGQVGLPILRDGRVTKLFGKGTIALSFLRIVDEPWMLVSTNLGIERLEKVDGQWLARGPVEGVNGDYHRLVHDDDGIVWAGSLSSPLLRLDFKGDISEAPEVQNIQKLLPEGFNLPNLVNGQMWVATSKGIWHANNGDFQPVPGTAPYLQSNLVTGIHPQDDGSLWLDSQDTGLGRLTPTGSSNFHWDPNPLAILRSDWYNGVSVQDGLLRAATADGLFFAQIKAKPETSWRSLVRRVEHSNNQLVDGGANLPLATPLPFVRNNLRFHFAAPHFENPVTFQYRLEGYEEVWSAPTEVHHKEYTNLNEGDYRFRVKAVATGGAVSGEGVYAFQIAPPWYRTWWAYLLYFIGLVALVQVVFRMRLARVQRINERLAAEVSQRTAELAEQRSHLEERNQQLEAQKTVIEVQATRLEEMDALKTRFFTNITHEFRTPLTLIIGPMEDMLAEDLDPAQKARLRLMLQNSQRLLSLINQLLDLSRLDAGRTEAKPAPADIVSFTRTRVAHFTSLAESLALKLEFQETVPELEVYFDGEMLAKILDNLLSNACKYTTAPGTIQVSVGLVEDRSAAMVSVADDGPGIAEEHQRHIFERFYQASQGRASSGIGLALVKELTALHGGEVRLISSPGKGCRLEVCIPLGQDHFEKTWPAPAPQQAPALVEYLPLQTAHTESEEDRIGERPTVLVVEDNPDVTAYITQTLSERFKLLKAPDGEAGLELALEEVPDLILSDVMMPKMDGFSMCRALKQNERTSHIPVILLTARSDQENRLAGLSLGADDYLGKPFNSRELLMRLENHIESRRRLLARLQAQPNLPVKEYAVTDVDEAFLEKAVSVTHQQMQESQFCVDTLASELALSRRQLQRKFKALLGLRPSEFIRKQRMERAALLLRGNGGNISEVAWSVGFETPTHFSKLFKDAFGQTPSAYAAQHGKKAEESESTN